MRKSRCIDIESDQIAAGINALTGGAGGAWDVDGCKVNPARGPRVSRPAEQNDTEIRKPILDFAVMFSQPFFIITSKSKIPYRVTLNSVANKTASVVLKDSAEVLGLLNWS